MKVYCLTETVERDGIRDFNIIQVYADRNKAIEEMNKCVAEDPYGDFKNKGLETRTKVCCESKYDEGFTQYAVIGKALYMSIKEIAYRKYQWNWLATHDYSIDDLSDIASDWFNERMGDQDNDDTLSDYIFDHGINGTLWACFDEFLNTEYCDAEYMKILLSDDEYADYCKDIGDSYIKEN